MNILIFGQNELIEHIEKGGETYSHCISITNPGKACSENDMSHATPQLFRNHFDKVLELEFWDSEDIESISTYENQRLPDESDIDRILRFVEDNKGSATGFTIHCWRGIARSAAVAYGLFYTQCGDELKAAEQLISIRRNAMPLKLVLKLYDRKFNSSLSELNKTIYRARMKAMRREMGL